jgi:hypothetical protein
MTKSISAIYENGVFRPLTPVDLPDHTPVVVIPSCAPGSGAGIVTSAGAWAGDDAALDEWLGKLDAMRRHDRSGLRADETKP